MSRCYAMQTSSYAAFIKGAICATTQYTAISVLLDTTCLVISQKNGNNNKLSNG